jgi:hypothetical protein
MFTASAPIRIFFILPVIVIMLGNYLTGFDQVHWVSYFVPAFFAFAAVTGFCPGLIITTKLFGKKEDTSETDAT